MSVSVDVVVPTVGRDSLAATLAPLADAPGRVLVVHDADGPLEVPAGIEVLRGPGRGPASARNVGWRVSAAEWIAFLDDDVVPDADWLERLADDLAGLPWDVAGSQGRLRVPLPAGRRPTDRERSVAGLAHADWATADMAYRRAALVAVGGFDERFPRAYREDADLALRVRRAGWRLVRGSRTASHPVRPGRLLDDVRLQAGNADDALMNALHGRGWRRLAGAPAGRRPWHLATAALLGGAAVAATARRPRAALVLGAGWAALTADFAVRRIAPGPRTGREVGSLLLSSALIPPAAAAHWLRGTGRARRLVARGRPALPAAVLLDRDGTLVVDVPYNGEPERVVPVPDARAALDRLREARIPTAVVSNQSGVARGLLTREQVDAVNRRVEELLGPLGPWLVCAHGPEDDCECRKPAPGLVVRAAAELGVEPGRCAVIGDVGADVDAARAAGARGILVPTAATREEEIRAAPEVAPTLSAAVELLLGPPR